MMLAELSSSADPWLGLGVVGLLVLGFVAFTRGGFGVVLTCFGTIAGGAALLARLTARMDPRPVTMELRAGAFFLAMGVSLAIVLVTLPKRA